MVHLLFFYMKTQGRDGLCRNCAIGGREPREKYQVQARDSWYKLQLLDIVPISAGLEAPL